MLTRIEISGFKTFDDFSFDVPPFIVVLGANASGKSNLFDAIQLFSKLADNDLKEAFSGLRGEPHELFRRTGSAEASNTINLSAEILLNPQVIDPWGSLVKLTHTRLRYEVVVERYRDEKGIEKLKVLKEHVFPIFRSNDKWVGRRWFSPDAKSQYFKYRRKSPLLTTTYENNVPTFNIAQDGKQGRVRTAPAAEATILSSMTSSDFPHLFALREELRSWRMLQLDPTGLRKPSLTTAPETLQSDGSNLATVLARLKSETSSSKRPSGILADISADLASIVPGVLRVDVEEDARRREFQVDIIMRDGFPFSSRVISDGTLRVLALLTMLHDPKHKGLVCFEEPENGIHPSRLNTFIRHLRNLTVEPLKLENDSDRPLSQMMLNSHSPVVLSTLIEEGEVVFADLVSSVEPQDGEVYRRTRVRDVSWQAEIIEDFERLHVSTFEVDKFLSYASREGK